MRELILGRWLKVSLFILAAPALALAQDADREENGLPDNEAQTVLELEAQTGIATTRSEAWRERRR